ncbi:MurR/RpiR family transcriptional regulator [Arthrobacter sp. NPDC080073]|uniref:MurR/RpiR family transcriptional regulator n=1 Tax=Arthrobacter sp. NPDC080073 TaxID=3155919 RepID=UPI00341F52E5
MNDAPWPKTYSGLRDRLQEGLAGFAPGQGRIARMVLTDPEGTAMRTLAENARAADVHESSLVRFAKGLGLEGYPALIRLCREYVSGQAHLVQRFDAALKDAGAKSDTPDVNVLAKATQLEQRNIAETFGRIDPADWELAVTLLAEAPSVYVMGLRKCRAVAELLSYLLHMVRNRVQHVDPPAAGLVDYLREFNAGDVFVAISIRRYTRATVNAAHEAHRRGLKIIALTDNPASPLAKNADVVFYVDSDSPYVLRSLTAFISLAQSLAGATSLKLGAQSRSQLLVDEELLESFAVYTEAWPEEV